MRMFWPKILEFAFYTIFAISSRKKTFVSIGSKICQKGLAFTILG